MNYLNILKQPVKTAKKFKDVLINTYERFRKKKSAIILIYHRVGECHSDPQLLMVSKRKFEEQIKYLKANFKVISLQELIWRINAREEIENCVVITFDDGYADNFLNARPILEKYDSPATVFVTSGMIGSDREYWWDELERIFLTDAKIYKNLLIEVRGKKFDWKIDDRLAAIGVYGQIHPLLKNLSNHERETIIRQMIEWAGLDLKGRETHRSMNQEQLREIVKNGLIEVGAHTITHCMLSAEEEAVQKKEIIGSGKALEDILNCDIKSFSYPFGTWTDATAQTLEIVRNAGYNCAIANVPGNVYKDCDLFWMPRYIVRNWDINVFQQNINTFFHLNHNYFDYITLQDMYNIFFKARTRAREAYSNILIPSSLPTGPIKKTKRQKINSVLQINTNDSIGGAARVANNLLQAMEKKGFISKMLVNSCSSEDEKVEIILRNNSYYQKLLWYYQRKQGLLDFFHFSSFGLKDNAKVRNSDIIHFHNLHGDYFSPFCLPELTRIKPSLWTLHDMQALTGHCAHSMECDRWIDGCGKCPYLKTFPSVERDMTSFVWKEKKRIYENSDLILVCPSMWLKKCVEKSVLKSHDVHLIYNGVDTSIFKPADKNEARKILGLPLERTIFLFNAAGGIGNKWKGSEYLLEVYARYKDDPEFLFLNVGGAAEPDGQPKAVNWIDVPFVNDEKHMARYYSAADLFLYPSLADNCPLVILESMACATPVITFKTGGIPELVKHLETGYLAEYKNTRDFMDGIDFYVKNRVEMTKSSFQASEHVNRNFSLNKMIDSYMALYEKVFLARK